MEKISSGQLVGITAYNTLIYARYLVPGPVIISKFSKVETGIKKAKGTTYTSNGRCMIF